MDIDLKGKKRRRRDVDEDVRLNVRKSGEETKTQKRKKLMESQETTNPGGND